MSSVAVCCVVLCRVVRVAKRYGVEWCVVLCCSAVSCTVLWGVRRPRLWCLVVLCVVLQYIMLCCVVLCCVVLCCIVLCCSEVWCGVANRAVLYYSVSGTVCCGVERSPNIQTIPNCITSQIAYIDSKNESFISIKLYVKMCVY